MDKLDLTDKLQKPDLVLYTDGSSFMENGKRIAGYAMVPDSEVVEESRVVDINRSTGTQPRLASQHLYRHMVCFHYSTSSQRLTQGKRTPYCRRKGDQEPS